MKKGMPHLIFLFNKVFPKESYVSVYKQKPYKPSVIHTPKHKQRENNVDNVSTHVHTG